MSIRPSVKCLLLLAVVAVVTAQPPSPYSFFPSCPEGCRDVDIVQSCGSVAALSSCTMADNGDVTMQCSNGDSFFLGQFGCPTSSPSPLNYFFTKTRHVVAILEEQYSRFKTYFAPVLMVISVWVSVAGYRFIGPTLTIYAFLWEFFFALFLLVLAGATDDQSLYISLGLALLVAVLCLWRGPTVGRAVVGVCMGSLVSILALSIASVGVGYTSIFIVIGLDIVGVIFAYRFKRSSLIGLFSFSVLVMVFVATASFAGYTATDVYGSAQAGATLIIPALVAGGICLAVNIYWCRKSAEKKRVSQRFERYARGRTEREMMLDLSMVRPGEGPADARRTPQQTPTNRDERRYGAVYEGIALGTDRH